MTNYDCKYFKKILNRIDPQTGRVTGFHRFLTSFTGLYLFNYMSDLTYDSNRHTYRFPVGPVRPVGPNRVLKLCVQPSKATIKIYCLTKITIHLLLDQKVLNMFLCFFVMNKSLNIFFKKKSLNIYIVDSTFIFSLCIIIISNYKIQMKINKIKIRLSCIIHNNKIKILS